MIKDHRTLSWKKVKSIARQLHQSWNNGCHSNSESMMEGKWDRVPENSGGRSQTQIVCKNKEHVLIFQHAGVTPIQNSEDLRGACRLLLSAAKGITGAVRSSQT